MKPRSTWIVAALGSLLSIGVACLAPSESSRADAPRLAFIERLSAGASAQETLPLLIVIHGLGDSPEGFAPMFAGLPIKARIIAPRAPDPWGEGSSWYPIDDEARKPRVIAARAQLVAELVKHVTRTRPTAGKPVVTGFSQGGVLSFALAAAHASLLRAALPIAGSLPGELAARARSAAGFELIAFHGTVDRRIPFAEGERSVRALSARGMSASLQTFEGVGHQIPAAMQSALFAALERTLRQTRSPTARPVVTPAPTR